MLDLKVFVVATAAIVLAELGDKTQLTAIALSSCSNPLRVFLGCFLGFTIVNLATLTLGGILTTILPSLAIKFFSILMFLIFGILILKEEKGFKLLKEKSGILASLILVGSMELGDKTNLAVLALATYFQTPLEIILSVIVSSFLLMSSAIILGSTVSKVVNLNKLRIISASVFLLVAIWMISDLISTFFYFIAWNIS